MSGLRVLCSTPTLSSERRPPRFAGATYDFTSHYGLNAIAGLVALPPALAARPQEALRARNGSTDHRGVVLRLGPAAQR